MKALIRSFLRSKDNPDAMIDSTANLEIITIYIGLILEANENVTVYFGSIPRCW